MASDLTPALTAARRLVVSTDDDPRLLAAFVARRDPAAFAALVRRHGPMVLAACARILGHRHDAEDAFQATFLILANKAAAVGRPERLAGWLHGVATRTAHKMARQRARRRTHPGPLPEVAAAPTGSDLERQELRAALDGAIQSLPPAYRAAFVLCHLEGLTQAEAARRLGWPLGTVATRVNRARSRLRQRLAAQGLGAAALAGGAVEGSPVPPTLAAAAVQAAMTGVMAARLVPLVQGGAWMFGLKWFVLVALTAGLVGWQTPGAQPLPPGGAVRAVVPPRPVPVLVVTADKIRIDEKANLLWVDGPGTLRLQVKTSLLGQPLDRPAALNLRWSECLQFNGLHLFCRGTVALELGGTLVQCKAWYAKVTEMLPLTAALRGGQPATLELGKGDGDVCLTWPVGPWVLKGLTGRELGLDAVQNALTVTGPGTLEVVPNPAPEDKQPPPVPLRIAFEKGFMTCQNGSYLAADAARVEFGTEPATTLQGKEIQFRLIRGPKGDLYRRWSAQGRAAWNGAGMEATAQHIAVEETRQIMDLRGTPEKPAQVRSEIGYGPPQIVTGQAIRITTDNGKRLVEVR